MMKQVAIVGVYVQVAIQTLVIWMWSIWSWKYLCLYNMHYIKIIEMILWIYIIAKNLMDVYVDVLVLKCMEKYLGMLKMLIFTELEKKSMVYVSEKLDRNLYWYVCWCFSCENVGKLV